MQITRRSNKFSAEYCLVHGFLEGESEARY